MYFEATAKLTGDMLVKVDRMSMANSLEIRCPLLDDELAELASRIPHAWKLKNNRGKDIFIQAVGHRLPPALLNQPKRGFGVPLAIWMRGPMRSFLFDHLSSRSFLDRGMISPQFVGRASQRTRPRTPQQSSPFMEALDAGAMVSGIPPAGQRRSRVGHGRLHGLN